MKITDKHGQQWQLVPYAAAGAQVKAASWDTEVGAGLSDSNVVDIYDAMLSAAPEPDLPEGLEPVGYLHENRNRSDVITKEVKKLLHDAAQSCDYLHRPIDKSEHYTEPLVLQSAALAALAEKDAEIARLTKQNDALWNKLHQLLYPLGASHD